MQRVLIILFVFAVIFVACKGGEEEKKINAQQYNDEMVEIQKNVDRAVVKLIGAIDSYEQETMLNAMDFALSECNDAIVKLEGTENHPDDGTYKKQMLQLLAVYKEIIENEFFRIIEIYSLPDEEYNEEHVEEVSDLFDEALTKYAIGLSDFSDFQERFARAQGLVLAE